MSIDINSLVEITLSNPDDFLKVRETLTRIGVASRKDKILYQSCHILHKQGRYFIVHFKELFALDGKPTNFSENDQARRNTIANLLAEWGLIKLINPEEISELVFFHFGILFNKTICSASRTKGAPVSHAEQVLETSELTNRL